jgi:two-component system, NarL family, sensor kinase
MTKPYSVAEQLQVDGALRASEDRFEMAFHSSPVAMAITTVAEGRYLEVNEAFERQMGYSRFEICGRTSLELNVWANPDDRSAMIQALERHKTVRDQHAQFRTKSGHLITTLYSAGLVTVDSRPCVLAAIVDITAQVVAEDALREHTALLQTLIANSPFGIIVGGKDHRIRFCNEAFTRMFLYAGDEVVGKDPDELVGAADDADAKEISRRVLSGEVVHATATRRRKDGSAIDVDLHAIPLKFGAELVGCFGIYQDITERVEAESKLRGLRARLSRVQDEERAHVARELHDDIGQQLALLALQLAGLQKEARDDASGLAERLEEPARIINDICADLNRLSHRLHPAHLAYLGLTQAVASICGEFSRQTAIAIDFEHDDVPALPSDIATCLYRVAQEAIRNAARHSGSSRVRVQLTALPDSISLCVSDTGRGFDPGANGTGAGLGLMSMAERVRNLGGHLAVRSAIDQGTRVEATIPFSAGGDRARE